MARAKRIVLIGAESTGKSTLCKQLTNHFNAKMEPEYARAYIEALRSTYTYTDVLHIAKKQMETHCSLRNSDWVFYDTDLIITKVWLDVVFGKVPGFINDAIMLLKPDMYLLCDTDIVWQYDPVRENSGSQRLGLQKRYIDEIKATGVPFFTVSGNGNERLNSALKAISLHFGQSFI